MQETDSTTASKARWRGRLVLVLLAALFILPIVVATAWYYHVERHGVVEPTGAAGELILPPVAVGDGIPRGKWTVLQVTGERCDGPCRQRLHDTRQVRTALHKDSTRVHRLLLHAGAVSADFRSFIAVEHPDLEVATVETDNPLFEHIGAPGEHAAGALWIVDPLGNLMMHYPDQAPARGLLDDLKRLLRLSGVG